MVEVINTHSSPCLFVSPLNLLDDKALLAGIYIQMYIISQDSKYNTHYASKSGYIWEFDNFLIKKGLDMYLLLCGVLTST